MDIDHELNEEQPRKKIKLNDKKVKKKKESNPTREELAQLRENEIHFPSSLFRLQTEELLREVRVNNKTKESFQKWFEEFKQFIYSDKTQENVNLSDKECTLLEPVLNRCPNSTKKDNIFYYPPEEIKLIGSFPLGLAVKSTLSVDVLIRFPKKCFYTDDNLNLRYFYKRALYISYLAELLKKADTLIEEMYFEYHHDDKLKPIVAIRPKGSLSNIIVKLLPCPPANHFKFSKLEPERNNVRYKWMKNENSDTEPPTPHYNSSLLSDILMESSSEYLKNILTTNSNVSGGIILLKVWSHQRQLDQGYGAINNYILTSFVAHLLQNKKLHPLMSSYQIVRNTWLALSQSDWTNAGTDQLDAAELFIHFPVVFADSCNNNLNLCSNVEKYTFLRLKHEAELAFKLVDTAHNFDALFMQPVPFLRKFDHILQIQPINYQSIIKKFELTNDYIDFVGDEKRVILPTLTYILYKALGNRIDVLDVKLSAPTTWKADEKPSITDHNINVGFLLNQDNYCDVSDKGPSAETEEAKEFREFWGDKSELRRFKDTTICEAVTWPCESMSERRVVCLHVVKYILQKHLNIKNKSVKYIANQVDPFVSFKFASQPDNLPQNTTGEEMMVNVISVLDKLRKQTLKLKDLPLEITSIQGVSPAFRYSEVLPLLPQNSKFQRGTKVSLHKIPSANNEKVANFFHPLEVIITLEGSNKWPNDVEAVGRIKAAFYIKLANLLKEQRQLTCLPTTDRLFVLKGGFLFSISIGYKRETTLMKMKRLADGTLTMLETEKSVALEKDIIHLPKITSLLHGLQLQQGSFSCACRLAKRWISSQLLADHVSDMTIELTMAHLFMSSGSYTQPKSPQVAFLRWLCLIAHHNWRGQPLILNFNNELTTEDLAEITKYFLDHRSVLPPLFIATSYDKFTSCWSKNAPCLPVLNRLIKLATVGLNILESELENSNTPDIAPLFRPSFAPYDVLIHLDPKQIARIDSTASRNKSLDFFSYSEMNFELFPICGYDPVSCYLKELQTVFGSYAVFFYDKYGGDTIAVLWMCDHFKSGPFKVSQVSCKKPASLENEEDSTLAVNVEAVVEDFKVLGRGLVKSVEMKTEKWKI